MFIGHAGQSCQVSTLKVYFSAIRALHIQMGYADPFLNQQRIPLVIRGLQRSQSGNKPKDKLPVTALVLYSIKLQLDHSKEDDIILWAHAAPPFSAFCGPLNLQFQVLVFSPNYIYPWLMFLLTLFQSLQWCTCTSLTQKQTNSGKAAPFCLLDQTDQFVQCQL